MTFLDKDDTSLLANNEITDQRNDGHGRQRKTADRKQRDVSGASAETRHGVEPGGAEEDQW